MSELVAAVLLTIVGAALVVAGVALVLSVGAALIVAGAALAAAGLLVNLDERNAKRGRRR